MVPSRSGLTRCVTVLSIALTIGLSGLLAGGIAHPGGVSAAAPVTQTYRCYTLGNTFHQIFGPDSMFHRESRQGPHGFQENGRDPSTVTYPLRQGTSRGRATFYVITDASTRALATALGVNFTPKLANAVGSPAVQVSRSLDPTHINFPASVNFAPREVLVPGPQGFPPSKASPGAIGEPGYSPLVELANGAVVNAPQISNATGTADKVVSFDLNSPQPRVTYRETEGCYEAKSVHYNSFDASIPLAAALEDVTYAPAMGMAPRAGCGDNDINRKNGTIAAHCSRETLVAFINGQVTTRQRQGLNAAVLNPPEAPMNILEDVPNDGGKFNYSPLWDVHLAAWTPAAIAHGQNTRVTAYKDVITLVSQGLVMGTGPKGSLKPTGFIVNCPLVSIDATPGM